MKSVRESVVLSWVGQSTYILVQLIRIHLLYRIFETGPRGTWFLMVSMAGFIAYLELGFGGAFARFYARCFGYEKKGDASFLKERNIPVFSFEDLAGNAKIIFFSLAICALLIALPSGFLYLHTVNTFLFFQKGIALTWLLFALSQGLAMIGFQYSSILQGRSYVGLDTVIRAISYALGTLLLFSALFFRSSLIYVACLELIRETSSLVLLRSCCKKYAPEYFSIKPRFQPGVFKALWKSSSIPFISMMGANLLYNTDAIYIASFLQVQMVSDYYNTNQFVNQSLLFCNVLISSSLPAIIMNFGMGNINAFRALFGKVLKYSVLLYGILGVFILFSGNYVLTIWLGKGHFVGYPILISLLLFYFFEVQNTIFINAQFPVEKYPLLWSFWASAGLRYGITLLLFKVFHLHLLAVIFGKLFAQLLTVTWFSAYFFLKTVHAWPLDPAKLKKAFGIYSPILALLVIGYLTRVHSASPITGLILQSLAYLPAAIFAVYWFLEKEARENLLSYLKAFSLR